MLLFNRDLSREVCLIAEIGVNHEGDVDAALRMVRLAAENGAHAVKFQSYTPGRFVAADNAERRARVTRFGLNEAAHRRLAAEAAACGVGFFSSAISEDWVSLIAELSPVIKIASGDLDFEPVIRAAARTGKSIILSTGVGTNDEIARAIAWVKAEIGAADIRERLAVLHCISAYPTPIEDANLLAIPAMAQQFGLVTGYSNHVVGIDACLAAVALGATLIEIHFTDRKEGRTFHDHSLSADPADLRRLAELAPRFLAARGTGRKEPQPAELANRLAIRKGLVAARDLAAGDRLTADDLAFARPATEFSASQLGEVVGRRLTKPVAEGWLIPRDALATD